MNTFIEDQVYVLQIRHSGEDDEVFLFRHLKDARTKVYDFFGEQTPKHIEGYHLEYLGERYFTQDKGYFSIYTTIIQ